MEGLEKRTKVLQYSLELENFVSYELAELLDIRNYKISKSLGNGASSLSINQKLNLLLDVENITKNEKVTIENFMSIRNQFMHNIDASSYNYVIAKIDGLENKLRRQYPEHFSENSIEKSFELCIDNLYLDSIKILLEQKGNKLRKIIMLGAAKSDEILKDKLQESINKNIKLLEDFIENYPENKIEKSLISCKIIMMDIAINNETIDNTFDELFSMQKREEQKK